MYFVFNAYEYTKNDGVKIVVIEANNLDKGNAYPLKLFYNPEEFASSWLQTFYDKEKPGLWLSKLYLKVKIIREVVGASDTRSDLE